MPGLTRWRAPASASKRRNVKRPGDTGPFCLGREGLEREKNKRKSGERDAGGQREQTGHVRAKRTFRYPPPEPDKSDIAEPARKLPVGSLPALKNIIRDQS